MAPTMRYHLPSAVSAEPTPLREKTAAPSDRLFWSYSCPQLRCRIRDAGSAGYAVARPDSGGVNTNGPGAIPGPFSWVVRFRE